MELSSLQNKWMLEYSQSIRIEQAPAESQCKVYCYKANIMLEMYGHQFWMLSVLAKE